ncbi:MAG: MarR family winged helix-turn-helix transcriptional regulator [Acidimicrobiales bacterium]
MELLQRRLILTAKDLRADFDARLARLGAGVPTWVVLRSLVEENGLTQRDLAQRMRIEAPTLTRQLDRMADDGLVARRRDDADRRMVRVDITPAGRRLHRRLLAVAAAAEADLRSLMTAREIATMERLLDRISSHLEERRDHGD